MKVLLLAMTCTLGAVVAAATTQSSRGVRGNSGATKLFPKSNPKTRTLQKDPLCYSISMVEDLLKQAALDPSSSTYSQFLWGELPPSDIKCEESDESCDYYFYQVPSIQTVSMDDLDSLETDEVQSLPCVRCEIIYETLVPVCSGFSCDSYTCLDGVFVAEQDGGRARNLQATKSGIRFDGVYQYQYSDGRSTYLQFHDNGQVFALTSDVAAEEISPEMWSYTGTYTSGDPLNLFSVMFSLTDDAGTLEYSATIGQDLLTLDSADGSSEQGAVYSFVPLDFEVDTVVPGWVQSDSTVPPVDSEDCSSGLYGIGFLGQLYRINKGTGDLTLLANTGLNEVYAAATDSKGRLFAMTRASPDILYEIDATTGSHEGKEVMGISSDSCGVVSLAIDSQDSLFAIVGSQCTGPNVRDVYKIDLETGNATALARDVGFLQGCTVDTYEDDMMYCLEEDTLIKIDPYSGNKTTVAEIPYSYGSGNTEGYSQGVEYDPCQNKLWMAYSGLASFDLNDGTITEVAEFEGNRLFGLFVTTTVSETVVLEPEPISQSPSQSPSLQSDEVTVCQEFRRFDSFSIYEARDATNFKCVGHKTASKEFYYGWTKGVTNVEETALLMTRGPFDDTMTECSYLVDGEECNSCELCDPVGWVNFAADCTNLATGANTTCDVDAYDSVDFDLFVLQEEFVDTSRSIP
jgi:hypothetical protein